MDWWWTGINFPDTIIMKSSPVCIGFWETILELPQFTVPIAQSTVPLCTLCFSHVAQYSKSFSPVYGNSDTKSTKLSLFWLGIEHLIRKYRAYSSNKSYWAYWNSFAILFANDFKMKYQSLLSNSLRNSHYLALFPHHIQ